LILDLSELDLNDERRVRVSLGAGNLNVIVPRNLAVTIDAEGGAGEIVLFGEKTDGVALDRSFTSPDYADADARLELELEVGAGAIEVSDE
jgi:predicted membrane protein